MKNFIRSIGRGLQQFFQAIWRFVKRHKRLSVFLLVLAVVGTAGLIILLPITSNDQTGTLNIPDTTVLSKMDLELTVTATGTLQSVETQQVTSNLSYDIKEILVEVGDMVEAGQLLCVLDGSELNDAISDIRADIAEAAASDKKDLARMAEKLQDAKDQRESNWSKNQKTVDEAEQALNTAKNTENNAKKDYDRYIPLVAAAQSEYNSALAAYDSALAAWNKAKTDYSLTDAQGPGLTSGADGYAEWSELESAKTLLSTAETNLKSAQNDSGFAAASTAYEAAKTTRSNAQSTYDRAVETRDSAYTTDTKSIETAQQNYDDQAERDSAETLRDQLEDYLEQQADLSITAPIAGMVTEMSAKAGDSAGGSGSASSASNSLSGAGTGATSGSGLFTIENVNRLEIPVSVAEYDAVGMKKGLSATVTSDALEDETWEATVTSVSPKASNGYFTVTVEVSSPVGELAIGMSATVDIITQSRQDVYAVPYDAVVTNSAGQTVVYALESGGFGSGRPSGGTMDWENMPDGSFPEGGFANGEQPEGMPEGMPNLEGGTFGDTTGEASSSEENRIEIVVETGLETDYYIEISGEDLRDGLLIFNDPLGINATTTMPSVDTGNFADFGTGGAMPGGGTPPGGGSPPF